MRKTIYQKTAIIAICILTWLALCPITITTFAYGMGSYTWVYMILYPTLLLAIFLLIRKVELGYYIVYVTVLIYAVLFLEDVEKYLVFDIRSESLMYVLFLPFIGALLLLALIPAYIVRLKKFSKYFTPHISPSFRILSRSNFIRRDGKKAKLVRIDKVIFGCKSIVFHTVVRYLYKATHVFNKGA